MSVRQIVFLCLAFGAFTSCFGDTLKRSLVLGNNGQFSVDWEVDFETETVVFTLDVQTTGFVGFGISMNPSMAGADIVIGGVRDGQAYFDDYHATSNGSPQRDASQDWHLISASEENNSRTLLKFSRKLNTCDQDDDVAITEDTQYIIWAIGDTDNIGYHGSDVNKRGPKIINLLDAPNPPADLTEYEVFQIRRTHNLLPIDTSYWCTIHRAPDFNGTKHHVIAFNTTLTSDLAIKHTHHLVLYSCSPPAGQSTDYFEQFLGHPGGECFEQNPVIPAPYCKNVLYIWAVGGEMMILPEMTGYPIGDTGRQEYLMFELHIDNPGLTLGSFESGIDLFYTPKLREIDAAVFGVAHVVNHLQIVPPRTNSFLNIAHCSAECTQALIPEEGMTLINVMFHAHMAGSKMRTRIIRDGVELPWLAVDNHYNFDYQANRPFTEYRKVYPGDHIITECTYDTSGRPNVTIGGHPSIYEMCQTWFWHYPKGLLYCDSTADPDLNELFGIEGLEVSEFSDEPIMTKPDRIAGMTFSEYLNTLNWTDDLKNRLENALVNGTHQSRCTGNMRSVPFPQIRQVYVEENVCARDGGGDSGSAMNTAKFVQLISIATLVTLFVKMLNHF